jgi:TIR domain
LHTRRKARHVLFLSHAGVDTEAARKLVDLIEATPDAREQGLKVWFDKRDLEAGSGWQQQLERAIEERSTAFAVYLGATGVINWVDSEVRLALSRAREQPNYRFIPIISASADGSGALPGSPGSTKACSTSRTSLSSWRS